MREKTEFFFSFLDSMIDPIRQNEGALNPNQRAKMAPKSLG